MSDHIKTERLTLRPVHLDDARPMAIAVGDIEVSKWLTHVPHPYSTDDATSFITRVQSDFPQNAAMDLNGQFVGMISAGNELGYWLGKPFWGQGLVPEAARAMLARYFSNPANSQLGSGYILGNTRSRKILENLGFVNLKIERATPFSTGVETDVQKMHITRAAWQGRT